MVSNKGNVTRYINSGKASQQQPDPTVGLSDIVVTNNNGILRCQFNRTRYIDMPYYYSLSSSYYVLLAKGSLSESIKIIKKF